MSIKSSGPISAIDVNYELGVANTSTISFEDPYVLELSSGSYSDFYSKYTPFVWFAGGHTGSAVTGVSDKIKIHYEVRTASTSITAKTGAFAASGTSKGIVMGGDGGSGATSTSQLYDYVTESVTAGPDSVVQRLIGCSASAFNYGYFFAGLNSSDTPINTVQDYSFVGNSYSTRTNLGASIIQQASTYYGTGNYVLIRGGAGSLGGTAILTSYKYNLGTEITSSATNLVVARKSYAAVGDTAKGFFAGGVSNTSVTLASVDKYTYSTNVTDSVYSLSTARYGLSAAGDATYGFFVGGILSGGSSTNVSERFNFSSGGVSTSSSLGTSRYGLVGIGSNTVGVS